MNRQHAILAMFLFPMHSQADVGSLRDGGHNLVRVNMYVLACFRRSERLR